MKQYLEIKEQYPDAFLFYRLGDFIEMFNDDAVKGAQLLELTLTTRNKKSKTRSRCAVSRTMPCKTILIS